MQFLQNDVSLKLCLERQQVIGITKMNVVLLFFFKVLGFILFVLLVFFIKSSEQIKNHGKLYWRVDHLNENALQGELPMCFQHFPQFIL